MYYKYSKHRKHIILIILCLSLFMLLKIYSTKTKKYDADTFCFVFAQKDELCFNENMFFYDMNKNIYYFPIDKQYENDKFYYKIKNKDNLKKYTINSMQINTEEYSVSYNDEFHYQVFDNESVVKDITFMFTNLPIINVLLNNEINDQEQNAKFNIINLYGRDNNMISEEDITIRLRGQTSRHFPKKSYRIEFDDFKEKNISLSSFYISENKDWALDALYTDVSKIRNKLGNEIWNYINRDNVYSSDLNVDFIELYINNEYSGLYTYKNIVNRNKLNLKKINSDDFGILVKGINYKPIDWDATNLSNIEGAIYNSLEMKYPKDDINISKSWEIILPKLGAHYQNHTNSLELIQNNFIQENFINYKIFTELIGAIDNTHIKNMFFSMSNIKSNILITPWDLDLSFGLTYTENSLTNYSVKIYNQVNKPLISSNYIGDEDYIKALKERYYYLRQNGLNKYYLFNLIDNYVNEIYYASIRDSERWYEYDIIKETKEIKDWISKRFDFLDKKFKEL